MSDEAPCHAIMLMNNAAPVLPLHIIPHSNQACRWGRSFPANPACVQFGEQAVTSYFKLPTVGTQIFFFTNRMREFMIANPDSANQRVYFRLVAPIPLLLVAFVHIRPHFGINRRPQTRICPHEFIGRQ